MASRLRIMPLDRTIIARITDPANGAKAVASIARKAIAEAEQDKAAALGRAAPHETFVNGARSDRLEDIRPGGSIVAVFDLGGDVVRWVYNEIIKHAPVLSGAFRGSIRVYADGGEVSGPEAAAGAGEIVITTVSPYARKIEGVGAKKGQSSQAPDGVFEAVAALARARFGNIASISFSYVNPLAGGSDLDLWATKHAARKSRPHKAYQRDTRQPSIKITMR